MREARDRGGGNGSVEAYTEKKSKKEKCCEGDEGGEGEGGLKKKVVCGIINIPYLKTSPIRV